MYQEVSAIYHISSTSPPASASEMRKRASGGVCRLSAKRFCIPNPTGMK